MASHRVSLIRRSFGQVDAALWCLREHGSQLIVLAIPTWIALGIVGTGIALAARSWEFSGFLNFLLYGIVYPTVLVWVMTFAPLACSVFAWNRAQGDLLDTRQCFQIVGSRYPRWLRVAFQLGWRFLLWFCLLGLPFAWLWPRSCLAPMVALFEDEPRIFQRSRRLLKEEGAVLVLALIHFAMWLALLVLVAIPRTLIAANLLATQISQAITEYLWVYELLTATLVTTAMAVNWSVSLTLLYRNIREVREGDSIRQRIKQLQANQNELSQLAS